MHNTTDFTVKPDSTIREVMECLEASSMQLALVTDVDGKLLGSITDGDIRRALLRGLTLQDGAQGIMAKGVITALVNSEREEILNLALSNQINHIPIVDSQNRLVGVELLRDFLFQTVKKNPVLLMAGGLGTRLFPLTKDVPKPMLEVKQKPLLHSIIENFFSHGFRKFLISVNYLSDQIESYFEDGKKFGVEIAYIKESEKLGTGGALRLIKDTVRENFLVANGDLLTGINFEHLLRYHEQVDAVATMAVREESFEIPFGVVRAEGNRIRSIEEKPVQSFCVNAGLYALSPKIFDHLPQSRAFDMTDLFSELTNSSLKVCSYKFKDYWLDVGTPGNLETARNKELTPNTVSGKALGNASQ